MPSCENILLNIFLVCISIITSSAKTSTHHIYNVPLANTTNKKKNCTNAPQNVLELVHRMY